MRKGLSFAPSRGPNPFGLFKDLQKFIRTLTVKRHFSSSTTLGQSQALVLGSSYTSSTDHGSNETKEIDSDIVQILSDLWEEGHTGTQPTDWFIDPEVRHTGLRPKSVFFPIKSKGPYIETFSQAVYHDLMRICEEYKGTRPKNLSSDESKALKDLEINNDIIIKQADKGGSLVVQNRADYLREAWRLLSDSNTYMTLQGDPLPEYQKALDLLVNEAFKG